MKCYINPWVELVMQNAKWQSEHDYEFHHDADSLRKALRALRKDYMGSDLSLEKLVREDGQPVEAAVQLLSRYLSERAAHFLQDHDWQDYFYKFFYFTIQLFAHGEIGEESIDDLIRMAEEHERNVETLPTIHTMRLLEDIADDCWQWVTEYHCAPNRMAEAVTAAVGVLLGVVVDPIAA